jgi:hypothetical protein
MRLPAGATTNQARPVMHGVRAAMNGCVLVLNGLTGKLLSAKDYNYLNWGPHIDLERPGGRC